MDLSVGNNYSGNRGRLRTSDPPRSRNAGSFTAVVGSLKKMATVPLTTEAVALTEKKMDMTLDDIIKMTKTHVSKPKKQRVPNKSQKFMNNAAQQKSAKVKRFIDSRSSLRQGFLAQKRSNFQGNQFPLATEAARKAAVAPISNRAFNRNRGFDASRMRFSAPTGQRKNANGTFTMEQTQPQGNTVQNQRPQTLDSRFASMKEQRMRALSQQNNNGFRGNGGGPQRQQQWRRGRYGNNY